MNDKDYAEFKRYSVRVRRESGYNFKMIMDERQSKGLRIMPLDREKDPPLPDWARRLVTEKYLSRRMKLLLLKFHDDNIRQHRMGVASCAASTTTDTQGETETDEEE